MRIELRQILRPEQQVPKNPYEDPDLYYKTHYKQKKNLMGIPFEYVIAPHETVNRFAQESYKPNTSFGLNIDGKIFLIDGKKRTGDSSDKINPYAQIPYTGLLIYLDNLSHEELGKIIGEDKLAGKTKDQIKFITYRAVLYQAEKRMKPVDFINFVDTFTQEKQFPENVRKAVLKDIITYKINKVQQIGSMLPVLSSDQKKSDLFYLEERKAYNTAFQQNKHIRWSRKVESLARNNPHMDRLFGSDRIHSEGAAKDIFNHPECHENLPEVVKHIDDMIQNIKTQKESEPNQIGGVVNYLIIRHFTDTLDKKPRITIQFLQGLRNRVIGYAMTEIEKIKEVLTQAPQLSEYLQTDESFQIIVNQYLQSVAQPLQEIGKQFWVVPTTNIPNMLAQNITQHLLLELENVATGKSEDNKRLCDLLQLRASTVEAGLPTDNIDGAIKGIVEKEHVVFQQKFNVPALSQASSA